jgi:protease II
MDASHPDVEIGHLKQHGNYLYYKKRGAVDDYWNTYRLPLPLFSGDTPGASDSSSSSSLAQAVAAAAADAVAGATDVSSSSSSSGSREQLVLDENLLSARQQYWDAYVVEISPDGSRIAVGFDTVGDECYSLQVRVQCKCHYWLASSTSTTSIMST